MLGKRILGIVLCFPVVFMLCALLPAPAAAADKAEPKALVKIGDSVITEADLEQRIASFPDRVKQRYQGENGRRQLLEKLVELKIFSLEARAEKLDQDKDVKVRMEDAADSVLAQEYVQRKGLVDPQITEKEIEEYYEKNKAEFLRPALVKARQILIKAAPKASAEEISAGEKKARKIAEELKAGGDFTALAKQYSDDERSRSRGGAMGYVTKNNIPSELWNVAWSLKEGTVSDPVKTEDGFHIITVEEKQPERELSLQESEKKIRSTLETLKKHSVMEQEKGRLMKKYAVEFLAPASMGASKSGEKELKKKFKIKTD